MQIIYGLEDPRDRLYHYIGITDDVYTRFEQHVTGAGRNIEKNGWIWECRQDNIMIVMRELERVEGLEKGLGRERFWITYYLNLGHPLHNLSVAKGILKGKEILERRFEKEEKQQQQKVVKKLEKPKVSSQIQIEPLIEQALEAWNEGHTSIRQMAAILGVSTDVSYRVICLLDTKGLIVRDRRGQPSKSLPGFEAEDIDMKRQRVLHLFNEGYKTHREIASIMDIKQNEAYNLLIQLDTAGLIQRRKKLVS